MRRSPLVWRLARTFLPADFRMRHGAELREATQVHLEGCSRTRRCRVWLRASLDVALTGMRLRIGRLGIPGDLTGGLVQDIRAAVTGLARHPGFALVAILTLALGIGVLVGLAVAAVLACWVLARRATRVDPVDAFAGGR